VDMNDDLLAIDCQSGWSSKLH